MLVLADADGLGVNFNELGQRILQAVGYADGSARGKIEVGILFARQL